MEHSGVFRFVKIETPVRAVGSGGGDDGSGERGLGGGEQDGRGSAGDDQAMRCRGFAAAGGVLWL